MLTTAYYFLQVILCSGLMMGYYWLVLRNKRFHQYNRFYLLAIALLSWVVPLIKIKYGHQLLLTDPQMMQLLSVVADNNSQIEESLTRKGFQWNWNEAASVLYFTVAGILLVGLIRAFVRVYLLLKTHSCKSVGEVYLILTQAKGTPFSFFSYIFWNEEIDIRSEAGKQILQHELTHVHEKHSFDKIFIQLVLIVGWFNPFFWVIKKEMEMIHEFIADRKAVTKGDTASLAQMLLTAAYPTQQFSLTNPFFFSPIKRRLHMLTNHTNPRFSYVRRIVVLPLLAIVVVLFAFRNKENNLPGTVSVESIVDQVVEKGKDLLQYQDTDISSMSDTNLVSIKADTVTIIENGKEKKLTKLTVSARNTKLENTLIILDGKKIENTTLEQLDPDQIVTVDVLKGESATTLYGEDGKNGVILVRTKIQNTYPTSVTISKKLAGGNDTTPVITTAKIVGYGIKGNAGKNNFLKRNPTVKDVYWWAHRSLKMQVELKDGTEETYDLSKPASKKKAEAKYGQLPIAPPPPPPLLSARSLPLLPPTPIKKDDIVIKDIELENVIETSHTSKANGNVNRTLTITHRNINGNSTQDTIEIKEEHPKEFTLTQTPPEFPGGVPAWTKYLERNLNQGLVKKNGGPPGKYTVVVSFVIDKSGYISEVTAENDPGYGAKEEAIRLIMKGPRWKPAMQNGKPVIYRHKQSITFLVS